MHTPPNATQTHKETPHGAVTLRDTLVRHEQGYDKERATWLVDFWQDAIRGKLQQSSDEWYRENGKRIHKWYWDQLHTKSYHVPGWRVAPEHSKLFHEFKKDHFYGLKNLVEIVMRHFVEVMLQEAGHDVEVFTSSDCDDVLGWVDVVVVEKWPEGKKFVGVDIAVSESPKYLDGKAARSFTRCKEFNTYKWRERDATMPRQVFSIPPHVMYKFLDSYMESIGKWIQPDREAVLWIFQMAHKKTSQEVKDYVQSVVAKFLH